VDLPCDPSGGGVRCRHGAWRQFGGANVWSIISADDELGYVYLPVSTPSNDFYGGDRPGDNLFGDSIVCLDVRTGKRIWHYQLVHHGLWDYDTPAAPVLLDIVVDGRPIKAVAQVTKQGFCFVFDRVTGEPVWPIKERWVPPSTVPGESASPTQPFPTWPLPFDRQGLSEDDLIDFTPELKAAALEILNCYGEGSLFEPPSEKGALTLPSAAGGANWAGATADPTRGLLFIPSRTDPRRVWRDSQAPIWRASSLQRRDGASGAPHRSADGQTTLRPHHGDRPQHR
jgi:quinoprotein glucose dehydrogenase